MSSFTYENQGANTYLVCKIEPEEKVDTSILGMLTNNNIDGIAPTTYTQIDDTRILKYNITAKVSIAQIVESTMTKNRILAIFSEIIKAIKSGEEYMIDESSFVINKDYIFTDISNNKTELICLPVEDAGIAKEDLASFFKNILFNAKFAQNENNTYVTTMLNYLNTTDNFSIDDFYKTIQTITIQSSNVNKNVSKPINTAPVQKVAAGPINNANTSNANIASAPKVPKAPVPETPNANTQNKAEKPMSLFYLLQHYNSDNKRIYDEQKNAKKALKKTEKAAPSKKADKKKQNKKTTPAPVVPNIAIPGQPVAPVSNSAPTPTSVQKQPVDAPKMNIPQPEPVSNSAKNITSTPNINNAQFDFSNIDKNLNAEFDEGTVVIGEEPETSKAAAYLYRIKTNETIYITKSSFKIGRNNELVDYDLKGNKYVGRYHCHFIIKDDKYYIVDDNSRNHTYVDDVMLTGSTEVEITHGQRIKIADEDFEFRMY